MKVIAVIRNYGAGKTGESEGWSFIADSAVSNTGKPFYLPENKGKVTVSLTAAVKISRLGKFIDPKFAGRYYSEYLPAVHFHLPEYGAKLRELGLPETAAESFDKSLMAGNPVAYNEGDELTIWKNGEEAARFSFSELRKSVDEMISEVSVMNTLKMGDLLLPGFTEGILIEEGDRLEVWLNGEKQFEVKVK